MEIYIIAVKHFTQNKMNKLHEPMVSNCFYFKLVYNNMFSKESEDFGEVLEAWGKVIGINLDSDLKQER